MVEDIKRGAVRIITDVHDVDHSRRPGANTILRGEHQRDVDALVKADLELARMLDEFDGKLRAMNEGLFSFAEAERHEHERTWKRLHDLEARTLPNRIRRLRAWTAETSDRVEQWFLEAVLAIDASTDTTPRREERQP